MKREDLNIVKKNSITLLPSRQSLGVEEVCGSGKILFHWPLGTFHWNPFSSSKHLNPHHLAIERMSFLKWVVCLSLPCISLPNSTTREVALASWLEKELRRAFPSLECFVIPSMSLPIRSKSARQAFKDFWRWVPFCFENAIATMVTKLECTCHAKKKSPPRDEAWHDLPLPWQVWILLHVKICSYLSVRQSWQYPYLTRILLRWLNVLDRVFTRKEVCTLWKLKNWLLATVFGSTSLRQSGWG